MALYVVDKSNTQTYSIHEFYLEARESLMKYMRQNPYESLGIYDDVKHTFVVPAMQLKERPES